MRIGFQDGVFAAEAGPWTLTVAREDWTLVFSLNTEQDPEMPKIQHVRVLTISLDRRPQYLNAWVDFRG